MDKQNNDKNEKELKAKLMNYELKRWQKSRGKYVEFDIKTMDKYQKYYDEIFALGPKTENQKGMSSEQLEEPFISLGLANSRQEVEKLIKTVDDDGSGMIEFNEFLRIIKNSNKKKSKDNEKITTFFKNLSKNNISREHNLQHFSFKTIMGIMRRQNLLKTFLGETDDEKKEGTTILNAYQELLESRKNKGS
jgi:centrin-1